MSGPWQGLGETRPDGPFEPAGDLERTLRSAAERADHEAFTAALLAARVIILAAPDQGRPRRPTAPDYPWVTTSSGASPGAAVPAGSKPVGAPKTRETPDAADASGAAPGPSGGSPSPPTSIQVFTSRERVRDAGTGGSATTVDVDFAALIRFWPDRRWNLALNPGSPLSAEVPGHRVAEMAREADRRRGLRLAEENFWQQSRSDHELYEAAGAGDLGGFLHVLREAKVEVPSFGSTVGVRVGPGDPAFPWKVMPEKGRPAVLVFTPGWRQPAGVTGAAVSVRFADLLAHWPDPDWHLVFDPATPLEFTLTGTQVRALAGAPADAAAESLRRLVPGVALPVAAELARSAPPRAPLQAPVAPVDPADPGDGLKLHLDRSAAYEPSNELERALGEAAGIGARDKFLATLTAADVLLPVPSGHEGALRPSRPGFPWRTVQTAGEVAVPIFTSAERQRAALGDTDAVPLRFATLARFWPDPTWALLVNPGTPTAATLPGERVVALAERTDHTAIRKAVRDFWPQGRADATLYRALKRRDVGAFVAALLGERINVPVFGDTGGARTAAADPAFPWTALPVRGRTAVCVFTALHWMRRAEISGGCGEPRFQDLVERWPDPSWSLVVNVGTPLELWLSGDQMAALRGAPEQPSAARVRELLPDIEVPPETGGSGTDGSAADGSDTDGAGAGSPGAAEGDVTGIAATSPTGTGSVTGAATASAAGRAAEADRGEPAPAPAATAPAADRTPGAPARLDVPLDLHHTPEKQFHPVLDVERRLLAAAAAGDRESFLTILLGIQVMIPVARDHDFGIFPGPGVPGFPWRTLERDSRPVVPVFTTPGAMRTVVGDSPFVPVHFGTLIRYWPDGGWDLEVNPGSAIGATLSAAGVDALADRAEGPRWNAAGVPPQNNVEHRLAETKAGTPVDEIIAILRTAATLYLPTYGHPGAGVLTRPEDPAFPWLPIRLRGRPVIQIFTSPKLQIEAIRTPGFVLVSIDDVLAAWPDRDWELALNPGSAVEVVLPVRPAPAPPAGEPEPAAGSVAEPPPGPEPAAEPDPERPSEAPAEPAAAVATEHDAAERSATVKQPVPLAAPIPATLVRHADRIEQAEPAEPAEPADQAEQAEQEQAEQDAQPADAAGQTEKDAQPADQAQQAGQDADHADHAGSAGQAEASESAEPARPAEPPLDPLASFRPANPVEARLLEVGLRGDGDAFLKALITAEVLVPIPRALPRGVDPSSPLFPWVTARVKGRTGILLFTSKERMKEFLGESRYIVAHCAIITRLWPREDWALEVNPGTPVGAGLPGDRVRALADWAEEIGVIKRAPRRADATVRPPEPSASGTPLEKATPENPTRKPAPPEGPAAAASDEAGSGGSAGDGAGDAAGRPASVTSSSDTGPVPANAERAAERGRSSVAAPAATAPAPAAPAPAVAAAPSAPSRPVYVQKFVPHGQVDWYLRLGYDRVAGTIHRSRQPAVPESLARVYERYGLIYPGSPFLAGDESVHVVRWSTRHESDQRPPTTSSSSPGEPGGGSGGAEDAEDDSEVTTYTAFSTRIPHGTQMVALARDGAERIVAVFDADLQVWHQPYGTPDAGS